MSGKAVSSAAFIRQSSASVDLGYDTFDPTIITHLILWGADGVACNRNGS